MGKENFVHVWCKPIDDFDIHFANENRPVRRPGVFQTVILIVGWAVSSFILVNALF